MVGNYFLVEILTSNVAEDVENTKCTRVVDEFQ